MNTLRKLLEKMTSADSAISAPFTITFPNGSEALALYAARRAAPERISEALALARPRPAIVLMGGASLMQTEQLGAARAAIEDGIARFAADHGANVLTGGTAAGAMALIGLARQRRGYRFPLIGVAPGAKVTYPGCPNPSDPDRIALDANHTHFVLTDGDDFGAESALLASLGYTIGGGHEQGVLGIIVNGGEIVRQEAYARATGAPRFPLLVLEGSGRFADELAAARRSGHGDHPLTRKILQRGSLHFLPLSAGTDSLRGWLSSYFSR
ncbi:MAG: hypothetical protein SNJ59_04490 [Aggregatilineales bacterium]